MAWLCGPLRYPLALQMPDARSFLQPQRRARPNGRLPNSAQQDVRQDGRKEPEGCPVLV